MKSNVIFLMILSAIILSSCNYFKKHRLFSKNADTVLDMTVDEPEPIVEDTTDILIEEVEQPVTQKTTYAGTDGRYFMIVGSFQNYNLAELYSQKIQQMGYQSEIIEASNGFYRVTAKSYNDFQLGISEIDDFRSSITPGAWLHVKR